MCKVGGSEVESKHTVSLFLPYLQKLFLSYLRRPRYRTKVFFSLVYSVSFTYLVIQSRLEKWQSSSSCDERQLEKKGRGEKWNQFINIMASFCYFQGYNFIRSRIQKGLALSTLPDIFFQNAQEQSQGSSLKVG